MSDLPYGWTNATIEQLAGAEGLTTDGDWIETKDQDTNGDVRLIQLADIGDGEFRDRSARFVTSQTVRRLNCTLLEEGDLLIARMPDPLGRACVFPGVGQPAITAVDVFVWRPSPWGPSARWLMHFVNSRDVRNRMVEQAGGTTRQRIAGGRVKQLEIAVPPLPEQQRIVSKIDSLSTKSRRSRDHLDHVPGLVEKYKQAILAAAFTGDLTKDWRTTDAKHHWPWPETSLSEIAEVGTGSTPKRGEPRYYSRGHIPWVTSGAVNNPVVRSTDECITDAAIRETNCKVFPAGTLLMAMYGEGQTRGRVAVLGIDAATNQALAAIQIAADGPAVRDFVFWHLRSGYLQLRQQAAGGVQPNLNLGMIKAWRIPLPSREEQHEVVRRIETALGWIDRLAAEATNARKLIDHLDRAVLAKAFQGELVPQDPNDEPASVLLERIRTERAVDPAQHRRGNGERAASEPVAKLKQRRRKRL